MEVSVCNDLVIKSRYFSVKHAHRGTNNFWSYRLWAFSLCLSIMYYTFQIWDVFIKSFFQKHNFWCLFHIFINLLLIGCLKHELKIPILGIYVPAYNDKWTHRSAIFHPFNQNSSTKHHICLNMYDKELKNMLLM